MPSTTDNEYTALQAVYGSGLSMQDMRYKKYGGPGSPVKSETDLEYAYWGSGTSLSLSDKKLANLQTATGKTGSISDLASIAFSAPPARTWLFDVAAGTTLNTGNIVSTSPDNTKNAVTVSPGAGGTIKSSNVVFHRGGTCAEFVTASGVNGVIRLPFDTVDNQQNQSFEHFIITMPTQTEALFNARHASGVLWKIALEGGGTGRVLIQTSANGLIVQSAAGVYVPGQWNRFEWVANVATGYVSLNVYQHDSRTPNGAVITSTSPGSLGALPMATYDIGRPSLTTQTITHYFDTVQTSSGPLATAEIGPLPYAAPAVTIDQLFAQSQVYVGHRGSGSVWPEHTQVAYQGAVDSGAKALEMSIQRGSQSTWFHLHDSGATGLNRTTDRTGDPKTLTDAQLFTTHVIQGAQPNLGKYWVDNPPLVPRWMEMMALYFNKVVMFLESKDYSVSATDDMIAKLAANYPGYQQSVIFKSHVGNPTGMDKAKAAGMKVWCYVDDVTQLATASGYDYIGVPGSDTAGSGMSDADIASYVATGKPVLTWSPQKRSSRDRYLALGIKGVVSSGVPYTQVNVPNRQVDQFATNRWAPGDIAQDPNKYFTLEDGTAKFGNTTGAASALLGSLSPAGNLFTIDYDMQFVTLPGTITQHGGIAFSKSDDGVYAYSAATNTTGGYHCVMRADGNMQLYKHFPLSGTLTSIGGPVLTDLPIAGQWMHFQVEVTLTQVIYKRTDSTGWTITATDNAYRGTYFHLCRNYGIPAIDGAGTLKFRNVVVVQK